MLWILSSLSAAEPEVVDVMLRNTLDTAVHVTELHVEGDAAIPITDGAPGELAAGAALTVKLSWTPVGDLRPLVTLVVSAPEGDTRVPIQLRLAGDPLPDSSAAPRQVATGPLTRMGSLAKEDIDKVIKRDMNAISKCYRKRLKSEPTLAGKLTIRFVITPEGTVSSAAEKSSTLDDEPVSTCVQAVFMGMRFPEPKDDGIVIVSYPFVFSPG